MKKLLSILNCGLFGRNGALLCAIIAFVLTGLFAASCAKSEIAQDESIANAAQSGAAAEGQDDPAGDDQSNPDDPNPGDPSDPSVPVGPVQPGDDYISPDHFNMVQLTFGACADIEDNPSQPAQAGAFGTKGLFTPEEAASREEFLDDEPTKTYLSDVTEAGGQKKQYIYWSQGDKIKIYYTKGKQNFSDGTIKHGGNADSTIEGWVNENDDYYYAFYPNNAEDDYPIESSVSYEGSGSFTVTVPAVQNGDFGHCHMAVGKATKAGKRFAFTNVGSYMKFVVANTDATAITIQASNTSDQIVGTFTVPFAAEGLGIDEENITLGECSCSLRVNLPKPRAADLVVYVALLPNVNFSDGFRIRYEYDANGDDKDDDPHPGFAYVKRDNGARTNRRVDRKRILNFATASIPTLDARIIENYFVTTSGSCSDADVAGAGNSWGNALNATGLADLLSQPVDGSGSQINDDAFDKAWRLDGATIHMAGGSYTLSDVRMACTDYDHPFKVSIKGGYPNIASGKSTSATRDTTTNKTTFAGSGSARILTLGNQTSLQMDKVWMTGGRSAANSDCGVALRLNPGSGSANAYLTACGFKDNTCNHTSANGGAVALSSNNAWARFDGCHFYSNGTGAEQSAGAIYVWSADCLAELHLNGCTFVNNWSGYWGGAVGCSAGKVYINQEDNTVPTTFTTNYLIRSAGSWGGALCVSGPAGEASLLRAQNCDFIGNYVTSTSGGIGGAISVNGNANAVFEYIRCDKHPSITRNMARNGAYLNLSTDNGRPVVFNHSTFSDGQAFNVGGCMQTASSVASEASFTDCEFARNHCDYAGGVCHTNTTSHKLSFTNCQFISNYNTGTGGGGVLSMENGTATFTSCTFTANQQRSTSGAGGGVFWLGKASNTTSTNLTVKGCSFTATDGGNKALTQTKGGSIASQANGGGILYAVFGNVTFTSSDGTASGTRTTISGSSSASAGGAILTNRGSNALTINLSYTDISGCSVASDNYGGAIYTDAPTTLTSCSVSNNSAQSGGAVLMKGDSSTLTMIDTDIQNNTSTNYGGAVQVEAGSFFASNSSFSQNSAKVGGAIYSSQALSLTDCILDNNSATTSAAAIYVTGDLTIAGTDTLKCAIRNHGTTLSRTPDAPVIYGASSTISLDHCKINNNHFTSAGGTAGFFPLGDQTLSATDCVFVDNTSSSSNCNGLFAALTTPDAGSITLVRTSVRNCSGDSGAALYIAGGIQTETGTAVSITGGDFKGNVSNTYGAAINCTHTTKDKSTVTITINGTLFRGNTAYLGGGAIHANSSSNASGRVISLYDCTFDRNRQTRTDLGDGAGAVNVNIGRLNVSGCTFEGNSAAYGNGGAIRMGGNVSATYNMTWAPANKRSVFLNNSAPGQGGALAFLSTGTPATITLENAQFTGNTSGGAGGAVYFAPAKALAFRDCGFNGNSVTGSGVYGDAIACINGTSLSLTGDNYVKNHIIGHTSTYPIYSPACTSYTFTNHEFKNNTSTRDGCMINLDNSDNRTFAISGCNIEGNSAPNGGAIYVSLKRVSDITSGKGDCTIQNTTFKNNTATDANSQGGAIYWTCESWNNSIGSPKLYIVDGSVLEGNKAGKAGSAIYLNVGRVYMNGCSVLNNTFANLTSSEADDHGGTLFIASTYSKFDLVRCTMTGNNADGKGGVVNINNGRVFMTDCVCNNNSAYSRGGVFLQTGSGFLLARRCSFSGNRVTKSNAWGNFMHVNGSSQYTILLNSTIDDGGTASRACLNGQPYLMMVNSTLIGNSTEPSIRVEGNRSGLLLNSIVLNKGGGDAIFHAGNYNWSQSGGYNILGTVNQNGKTVSNIPGSLTGDQKNKTVGNMGAWEWNSDGYYSWNGKVGGTATATPAIVIPGRTDYVSVGMSNGFNYNINTISDGKDFSISVSNIGNNVMKDGGWAGNEYYHDQRNTGDRTTAGKNYPGAYCP